MPGLIIKSTNEVLALDMSQVPVDGFWNEGTIPESKMHSIHIYPAKFPAFIAQKAIDYAKNEIGNVACISDIFCGCGTVALEARRHNIRFWGCDINPVATLIAKVKSSNYRPETFEKMYKTIEDKIAEWSGDCITHYDKANPRLQYWYDEQHYDDLFYLKSCIDQFPNSKYKLAFYCLFSSILKPSSRWLTKSIKPQIDPEKNPGDVFMLFSEAAQRFLKIISEDQVINNANIAIANCNFLTKQTLPKVDLVVTSPPYVTSYEYADLHQLSSLWLGYAEDYTNLRRGTIGSIHNSDQYYFELIDLNETARQIVMRLHENKAVGNAKTKSVARYFIDMQQAADKCYKMLSNSGIACFVIGDTEYKGIKIENAKHLAESLARSGFGKISISKRKISKKNLSPYRDSKGKFSSDASQREVYHEEFVVIAYKSKEA